MKHRKDLLIEGLNLLGIPWNDQQIAQLSAYCAEVELWNKRFNLTRASGEQFIRHHVFDALCAVSVLKQLQPRIESPGFRIADVGSGNGIPGIPLAIMFPLCRMVLIERSKKRSGFLLNALAVTGISGRGEVFEGDLKDMGETFQLVTFRAVSSLHALFPQIAPLVEHQGAIAAYKGQEWKVQEELASLSEWEDAWSYAVEPIFNPFQPDVQRRLVYLGR